ncbi:MAG: endonuclease III [Nitrospirae bacterium]|nr:MAG: endonuclease III [Nitrospirota bacterium]
MARKARARRILRALKAAGPTVHIELAYATPFQLLIATILSAQSTDARVNQVTPALFARYPTPYELAHANQETVESLIRPVGLYQAKARYLITCSQRLLADFHGEIPRTREALMALPGVGRKTANVLLGACFGIPAVVVDTHVIRVANRLALTSSRTPIQIEHDLQAVLPRSDWTQGSQRLLLHGRYVCRAGHPACARCVIWEDCNWKGKWGGISC